MKHIIDCKDFITIEHDYFLNDLNIEKCQEMLLKQIAIDNKEQIDGTLGISLIDSYYYRYTINDDQGIYTTIWLQKNQIAKIEVHKSWTINPQIKQTIDSLGEPSLKLDYYIDVVEMKNKVWVYPQKGIALFLGFNENSIYRVEYYNPTTPEEYKSSLYNLGRPREF
ncbi:hypothetical protein [Dokdonia sp.]|uniref:hypothetical protein n=1 Tax=Dokdonia sp. TaxID=2024995 RepID=UPI00326635A2